LNKFLEISYFSFFVFVLTGSNPFFIVLCLFKVMSVTWQFISGQFISDNLSPDGLSLTIYLRQFISDNFLEAVYLQAIYPKSIYLRQFISDTLSDNLSPTKTIYPQSFYLGQFIPSQFIKEELISYNLSAFLNFKQFFAVVVFSISRKGFLGKNLGTFRNILYKCGLENLKKNKFVPHVYKMT
jgi:hypothetical protein